LGKDGFETLYGSESYYVGAGEVGAGGEGFGAVGDYIDVGQCKCAGHFPEEGGLLVIRFDQREMDGRGPDFQGKGGESGAGADVEDARSAVASTQYPVASCQLPVPSGTTNIPAQAELGRGTLQSGDGRGIRDIRGEEVAGEEEGFAEVAGYDFFGMADGGEVDAGVPAE
jgi:hypothetical protein